MEEAYSVLAKVYERLIVDEEYKKWGEYIANKVKNSIIGYRGIDCACGSGYFTRQLKRVGLDVEGVDFSQEMLTEAVKLTSDEGLNIRYTKEDMSNLKTFNKVDFITIINDGVNYLSPIKLKKAFNSFYKCLNKGGLLEFDFSTEYKLKNIIGNNLFGEDLEDCSYLWFNKLDDNVINMDLSFFIRDESGKYLKREEEHKQYIYSLKDIISLLKDAGFKDVKVCSHLGGEIKDDDLRLEVSAIK